LLVSPIELGSLPGHAVIGDAHARTRSTQTIRLGLAGEDLAIGAPSALPRARSSRDVRNDHESKG